MAATIRDIREKTGLSLATISKFLNGGNVLPENRHKIESAIEELHYEVNEIARGLVTKRTRTIGVIVFDIESTFNGAMLRYIGEKLRENGYGLLICDSCNKEEVERDNVRFLLSKKVDGMIIVPVSDNQDFLREAKAKNVPVVLLDRAIEGAECDCVRIDNRKTTCEVVSNMLQNTKKNIGIIYSGQAYTGVERYKGFMDAVAQNGCEVPECWQKAGVHSIEHGYESMKQLLELNEVPRMVFMSNYEITLGAVMALQASERFGLKDISMIGFDNLLLTHMEDARICMVVQPMQQMAEEAVRLLLRRVSGQQEENPVELILDATVEVWN